MPKLNSFKKCMSCECVPNIEQPTKQNHNFSIPLKTCKVIYEKFKSCTEINL